MFSTEGTRRKAIAYYRHSAEDKQENSVGIQQDQIREFAAKHDIDIIHEESDEGKSGLSAARPGFEHLFDDWVLNPEAPQFQYVLALDVTRWGRFQDPDEAAYWEMQCKKRDVKVIYITRGFPKEEEKLLSSLETSIGRYMAAEYSRQLSDKVWHGSIKVSEQGFSAGGTAPYGYVRVLLDEHHQRIGVLALGAHKVIANQRVTFEPANDSTTATIQRIFDLFVNHWYKPADIAESLNEDKIPSPAGYAWDSSKITKILTNETYLGTRVYNKTWHRLKQKSRKNPVSEWVRTPGAFDGIVSEDIFKKAQERLYWIFPSRWKYGIHQISRVERQLRRYIDELLINYDSDSRFEILQSLPIAFSLTYYRDGIANRCFQITETARQHSEIICISMNMFEKDKIDDIFVVPISEFGISSYLVLDDSKSLARQLRIEQNTLKDKIIQLVQQPAARS